MERALTRGKPEIFNSDQGSQITNPLHTKLLEDANVIISMDGKGRVIATSSSNAWRSLKYEKVYLKDYDTVQEAKDVIKTYFNYYKNERPHQSLDYKTPAEAYFNGLLEQADLSKNKEHSTGLNPNLISTFFCLDNRQ